MRGAYHYIYNISSEVKIPTWILRRKPDNLTSLLLLYYNILLQLAW